MNNIKFIQNIKFYLVSLVFSIIIIFYGNFNLRAYFSWLPLLIVVLLSFLTILKKTKLSKVTYEIFLINSLWLIYALMFSLSVVNTEIHLKAILETLLYIFGFTSILSYFDRDMQGLFKMLIFSIKLFVIVALLILLLRIVGLYDNTHAFSSLYSNRNTFAFMGLVYLTLLLNFPNKIVSNRYKFVSILIISILIMLTLSSKGLLGLMLVFLIHIFTKHRFKKKILLIPVFLIFFVGLLFVFEKTTQRLMDKASSFQNYESYDPENFTNDSGTIRIFLAIDAINIFLEHKLKGVGVNNGQYYLTLPKAFRSRISSINSQNNITEMLLNAGLPGFSLYYFPLIYLLYKSSRSKPKHKEIKVMIVSLIILKLFMDIGMKSYNDAGHVFSIIFAWSLFYKYIENKKHLVDSHSLNKCK